MFRERLNKMKGEKEMEKFNQMTEDQMSQVDGGIGIALVGLIVGIIGMVSGLVSTGCTIANTARAK